MLNVRVCSSLLIHDHVFAPHMLAHNLLNISINFSYTVIIIVTLVIIIAIFIITIVIIIILTITINSVGVADNFFPILCSIGLG